MKRNQLRVSLRDSRRSLRLSPRLGSQSRRPARRPARPGFRRGARLASPRALLQAGAAAPRRIWGFHGGIHPPENKRQSLGMAIRRAAIPPELIFPLSQHIGAPAEPVVSAGQAVRKGELIARASGAVSAPLHASTSGRVSAIEDRPAAHPSGIKAPCIVIESDGRDEWIERDADAERDAAPVAGDSGGGLPPHLETIQRQLAALKKELDGPASAHAIGSGLPVQQGRGSQSNGRGVKARWLERIREAGIAGLGGAGFPTAAKLNSALARRDVSGAAADSGDNIADESRTRTLIINGAECEPYITADDILMRERPEEVLAGAAIVQWLLQPEETVLGIEDNKPAAIAALREASASLEEAIGDAIDIAVIPTQYPSGGEKQLIEILTGRQVPSGGLPADIGAACINVGTCAAAFRALCRGEPLISRITTLTGGALAQPRNFEALIGTPVRCLLEEAGFDPARGARLVMGGPMMGFTLDTADVPVVKITNCILAPALGELPAPRPAQPCIRCGLCADACPASLLPQQLYWFAEGREYEKLERHNLFDCIECGACSWVCPSDIPLVQYYRAAKAEVSQLRRDQAKAEQSKARFEARQERVEREAAEREAQRAARRRAAAERAKAGADPVQAAIERAQAKQAALAEAANEVDSR